MQEDVPHFLHITIVIDLIEANDGVPAASGKESTAQIGIPDNTRDRI